MRIIVAESLRLSILICVFTLLLLLPACTPKPPDVAKLERLRLLDIELNNWQAFKMTGIIDIQFGQIVLKNNSVIVKNKSQLRADVLGSGLLGLGGGVLFAGYIDREQMQVKKPGSAAIENIKLTDHDFEWIQFFIEDLFPLLTKHRNQIADTQQIELQGYEIQFSPFMRLSEISNSKENISIRFLYDRSGQLHEIEGDIPSFRRVLFHVDKVEYGERNIQPLK
ncbi:MAG: hypothetical protein FWG20_05185 [Candidatus Cloacimonetes bacterium]|nr:hypothetical protein [Candidatus Cloacimonadota bacterium]